MNLACRTSMNRFHLASTRGVRASTPRVDATPREFLAAQRRLAHLVPALYLVVALAAPLVVYFGPDVLSPAAPVIATAAADGRLSLHASNQHAFDPAVVDPRHVVRHP